MKYVPRHLKYFKVEMYEDEDISSEMIGKHLFEFLIDVERELKEKEQVCDTYDVIYKSGPYDTWMGLTMLVFGDGSGLVICELSPKTAIYDVNPKTVRETFEKLMEENEE